MTDRRTVLAAVGGWVGAAALWPSSLRAGARHVTLASTTSTENSGLFKYLLPLFESDTGIRVRVVAVGTGQAIRLARAGDADLLLVHHKASEQRFVAEGYGVRRHRVMHNDFVVVGSAADPAGIAGSKTAIQALSRIARARGLFLSRGDDSGTHKKELDLWRRAGVDVRPASGTWYRETGSGMGATLNRASALDAYTLTDRATWISFRNKGALKILVQRDSDLFNEYGLIRVSPAKHPHVKVSEGKAFVAWMLSQRGRRAIERYRVAGQQLFFVEK